MSTKNVITLMQGRYATTIAASLAAINHIKEDDEKLSPKAIAVRACDIAHQLAEEIERRGWYVHNETPASIPLLVADNGSGDSHG